MSLSCTTKYITTTTITTTTTSTATLSLLRFHSNIILLRFSLPEQIHLLLRLSYIFMFLWLLMTFYDCYYCWCCYYYYSTTFIWICLFLVLRSSPLSALPLACVINTVRRDETPQAEWLQQQKEGRKRNTSWRSAYFPFQQFQGIQNTCCALVAHRLPIVSSPTTAALAYRKSAPTETRSETRGAENSDKRNAPVFL